MFLSKKSNGIYYIIYEKLNGKRSSLSTKTSYKKIAEEKLLEFQLKHSRIQFEKIYPVTLQEFRLIFLRYSETVHTNKTQKVYKTVFKSFLLFIGNIELSKITTRDIEAFLMDRRIKSSDYVARRGLICLSSAFNKAILDGYLKTNPCKGIKRIKIPEKQPLFFSDIDYKKLLEVINDNQVKDITEIAYNTGMRQSEILFLKWNQIDFDKRIITLDNRDFLTKSKRIRVVPINELAFTVLCNRKENAKEYVFPTSKGTVIDQSNFSNNYKKYIRAAKLNDKLNFHSLRHTFASRLVQKGISIYIVSKLLGHSDIKTTQIYAHLRTDDLTNAVNQLY